MIEEQRSAAESEHAGSCMKRQAVVIACRGILMSSLCLQFALLVHADVDFAAKVQPILEMHCLACHSGKHVDGGIDLASIESVRRAEGLLVPFSPDESSFFTVIVVDKDDPQLMPPLDQGGPLNADSIETLRLWIAQGAIWPKELRLRCGRNPSRKSPRPTTCSWCGGSMPRSWTKARGASRRRPLKTTRRRFRSTDAPYEMVAIEGGEFLMGSPAAEPGRATTKARKSKSRSLRSGSASTK